MATTSFIVTVVEDGIYEISLDRLAELGARPDDLDQLQTENKPPLLSHKGEAIPTLLAEDRLIFYGRAPADRYSAYRPYLLDLELPGVEIKSYSHPATSAEALPFLPYSQTFEENKFYDGRPYGGSPDDLALWDPWFWETIQVQGQVRTIFELPRSPHQGADIELALVGVSSDDDVDQDHDLDVIVNDQHLDTIRWDGNTAISAKVSVPAGVLQKGPNTLLLDNSTSGAAPIDIMRFDRFTVYYWAAPEAIDGRLETSDVVGTVQLTGFENAPLLFDISQPESPILLAPTASVEDQQTLLVVDRPTRLIAVDNSGIQEPSDLFAGGRSQLKESEDQADLIVIAPEEYIEALQPLAEHRRQQGLAVRLVALEQVYEEFVEAGTGPSALRAFIAYAYTDWSAPKPQYLLLVGEASYDYRNYLGQQQTMMIPSPMVPVTFSGETVSDARLADVDGDRRPDLAVGRWPVQEVSDVKELVRRTIASEALLVSDAVLFAADSSEARFADLNATVSQQAEFRPDQSVQLNGPTIQEIGEAWSNGAWIFTYTGHGSLDRWGKDSLLDKEHVGSLKSQMAPPIVLQLTCLTGLFAHPTIDSLSEVMLLHDQGPVAIIAATSLSLSDHQQPFGVAFLKALQDSSVERIGDAFQQAKRQLDIESNDALREISDTYTLFGDPTALIGRPADQ